MESELIYRSEAIEALLKQPNTPTPSVIRRVLRQVPTVDAVEVVRCKDCKHCFFDLSGRDYHICMKNGFLSRNRVQEDDFCSYGERRDD